MADTKLDTATKIAAIAQAAVGVAGFIVDKTSVARVSPNWWPVLIAFSFFMLSTSLITLLSARARVKAINYAQGVEMRLSQEINAARAETREVRNALDKMRPAETKP